MRDTKKPSTFSVSARIGFVVIALVLTVIGIANETEPLRIVAVILVTWFFYLIALFVDLVVRPVLSWVLSAQRNIAGDVIP